MIGCFIEFIDVDVVDFLVFLDRRLHTVLVEEFFDEMASAVFIGDGFIDGREVVKELCEEGALGRCDRLTLLDEFEIVADDVSNVIFPDIVVLGIDEDHCFVLLRFCVES